MDSIISDLQKIRFELEARHEFSCVAHLQTAIDALQEKYSVAADPEKKAKKGNTD